MFIPDQTKTNLEDLLDEEKAIRKLKKTSNTNGNSQRSQPTVFGGGIGDLDLGGGGCGDSGCHTRHEPRDMQRNAAKAMAAMSRKPEKRSFKQMIVGGIFLIALSGGIFSTIWTIVDKLSGASLYPYVDVKSDEATLKTIFFSGEPYIVYCQAGKSKLVPKMLIEGANMLPRGYSTAMMSCEERMVSSDGSVFERFNLDPKGTPAFVVANGDKPKQFNRESFYNAEYLAEFVKNHATPRMREVTNEIQFRNFCTEKAKCVAFGHKGKLSESAKSAIENANTYWRKQRVASIDTSRYSIKLDEALSASLEKQMSEGKTGKGYLSGLCVSTESNPRATVRRVTESEVYYFMKDCLNGVGLEEIKTVPSLDLKSNTKKGKKKTSSQQSTKPETPTPAPESAASQYADDGMEIEDLDE